MSRSVIFSTWMLHLNYCAPSPRSFCRCLRIFPSWMRAGCLICGMSNQSHDDWSHSPRVWPTVTQSHSDTCRERREGSNTGTDTQPVSTKSGNHTKKSLMRIFERRVLCMYIYLYLHGWTGWGPGSWMKVRVGSKQDYISAVSEARSPGSSWGRRGLINVPG